MRARCSLWFMCALLAGAAAVGAQQTESPLPVFRSAIELTTITATVLDRDGRLVPGLPREAFEVYEDGELQAVTHFTNERVPLSLAILLDVSDSMYGRRIEDAREAIEHFVVDLLASGDEFAILAFNHQPRVLTRWTSDLSIAAAVMKPLKPFGSTAIYDAIVAAMPLVEVRHRKRGALLVVSDGADTASDATLRDVRSGLLRSDAFVYAVAMDTPDRRPINTPINPAALVEITDPSGGRTKIVHSSGDLSTALGEIADELSSQYLIGYSSPKGADGKHHTIRVRIRGTDDRVRARRGYSAADARR